MPLTSTNLANLQALSLSGRVPVAEYIKVTWTTGVVNYYGAAAWNDEAPFTGIGHTIEPRLIKDARDPFSKFERNPDLRSSAVEVVFDDADKAITALFQTYSYGVTAEILMYYPTEGVTESLWDGQLQSPSLLGWKVLKTEATNGYRSRELVVPGRNCQRECTARVFGALLPDLISVRSNLCPYDKDKGGSIGKFKTGTTPYTDCPMTPEACIARLDMDGDGKPEYYGGFITDASAVVTDTNPHHFYLAASRGNETNLKEPIRKVYGKKYVRGLQLLQWRREVNSKEPEKGFVSGVWIVSEGPNQAMYNFQVNNTLIGQEHLNFRNGSRGQAPTFYAPDISNYSSTAHIFGRYGWVNAGEIDASSLDAECVTEGFNEVPVYTDISTRSLVYSTDRIWCLFDVYTNQKTGLGYSESKIEVADWITTSTWGQNAVSHTATYADGETYTRVSQQTTFNAILEGRAVGEQVEDICRSGGISVPFWHQGKLTISAFRPATSTELTNAPVFYDRGPNVNICWSVDKPDSGSGEPLVELSWVPDDKLTNEVEVRFEEASNYDTERPIKVDDKNYKLRAGRQLGSGQFQTVNKKYSGFGIVAEAEAIRLAYRLLKYGEFDKGGTDNNLGLKLTVPAEWALSIKRYSIFKFVSNILNGHKLARGTAVEETPQYFRALQLNKVARGRIEIIGQAYNHTSYSAFEVASVITPAGEYPAEVWFAGSEEVNDLYEYVGQTNGKVAFATGGKQIYWTGSYWAITVDGSLYYRASSGAFPWNGIFLVGGGCIGIDPPPTVSQGLHRNVGGEQITLGTPTYNTTTGELSIPIN